MNKILAFGLGVLLSTMAQANYLYWQVDSSKLEEGGISVGDGSYAKIVASTSSTYIEGRQELSSTYLDYVPSTGMTQSSPSYTTTSANWSKDNYAELGSYGSSTYTYFVEIYNSQNVMVGHSDGVAYGNIAMVTDLSDIGSATLINTFHGATYAVPEPTGSLLVLIGAAMLGLKRRKV